jgi:hypothetical protein
VETTVGINTDLGPSGEAASVSGYLGGVIDEPRVLSTNRPAGWVQTEYNNQKAGSAFLTVGGEETSGGP